MGWLSPRQLTPSEPSPEPAASAAPTPDPLVPLGWPGSAPVLSGSSLLALAWLAVLATALGRALAPALPGSFAGIELWISLSQRAAAIFTINFLVFGSLAAIWLSLVSLVTGRLLAAYRLTLTPALAAIVVLSLLSCRLQPLTEGWHFWLALIGSGLAFAAAPQAMGSRKTRALGLVLLMVAASAALQVAARRAAIRASDLGQPLQFLHSRWVATAAFGFNTLGLVLAMLWLGARSWRRSLGAAALLGGLAALISGAAVSGSHYDAGVWQVLASRVLAEMTRHPAPLVPAFVRFTVELLGMATATAVLLVPRRDRLVQSALALVLLSAGATDIPLCALMLALGALIAPLAAEPSDDRTEGGSSAPKEVGASPGLEL